MRLYLKQGLKKSRVGFAVLLLIVSLGLALGLSATQSGCGGGNCLADGENCSQSYLEDNDLLDHVCCDGQACHLGDISGVPICRF